MKIAYVIDVKKNNKSIGVLQKIEAQVTQWRKLGHDVSEVHLFDFYPNLSRKLTFLPKTVATFIEIYINSFALRSYFKKNSFDIVYSRALIFTPFMFWLKDRNYIMELNANDLDEYKKTSAVRYFYSLATRARLFSLPKGFVAVSNEIKSYYSNFEKQTLVVANACPSVVLPKRTHHLNQRPVIGFIGSNQYIWNGADKVLKLAEQFPEYDFEIIGFHLEEKASNVKTFGFLTEEESIKIMTKWNVAISTLSLYEQGLTEASPLKSRLYLAMNIPFLYAYDDTDEPFVGCLKIPNAPDNTESHLEEIKKFFQVACAANSTELKHNCSLEYKEKQRLDFMQKISLA